MDTAGEKSGYGYDFLQMIAGYANFKYIYVGYQKAWNDMLDMLDSGEIDMERQDARTIPIIAMTANAFAEDVQAALDNGMNAHIAKPISACFLMETLAKFIHGT